MLDTNIINKEANLVPEKTIAVLPTEHSVDYDQIFRVVVPLNTEKQRSWFPSFAYRCLPLTIGNQQGFSIVTEYDFAFSWNGDTSTKGIDFEFFEDQESLLKKLPILGSHFGGGIITVNLPVHFRTPKGVNLMTINPPNHIIPNITVLTGVVEADNLRRDFSFNLKVQIPDLKIFVPKGSHLVSFIPIPRYYCDSFSLVNGEELFGQDLVQKEIQHNLDCKAKRTELINNGEMFDRSYLKGQDIYGNKFEDHRR